MTKKNAASQNQRLSKDDPRYQPTKAELEEDMRIDATPDELFDALFGRHPRRTASVSEPRE